MHVSVTLSRIQAAVRPLLDLLTVQRGRLTAGVMRWRCLDWLGSLLEKYQSYFNRNLLPVSMVLRRRLAAGRERFGIRVDLQNVLTRVDVRAPNMAMILNVVETQGARVAKSTTDRISGFSALSVAGPLRFKRRKAAHFSTTRSYLRPVLLHGNQDARISRHEDSSRFAYLGSKSVGDAMERPDSREVLSQAQVVNGGKMQQMLGRIESQFKRVESGLVLPTADVRGQLRDVARPQVIYEDSPTAQRIPSMSIPVASKSNVTESESDAKRAIESGRSDDLGSFNINHVTDHVIRQLDQRFTAWRERMGKI